MFIFIVCYSCIFNEKKWSPFSSRRSKGQFDIQLYGTFPSSASETFSRVIHFTAINVPYSYNPSELVAAYFLLFISLEKC